ncbi:MAG TPA: site-specific DNA-methyltransferase [Erysipelotrichaceae bacterium]|nr:site-specific DNA-methyltransferase [Erysipelotrichaceae bacterium]
MKTNHILKTQNSSDMKFIKDESVNLVVTSPPYPMIEMWDEIFASMNPDIKVAINNENGNLAFELMHKELDKIWNELYRVMAPGGIVCINIGDATRTIDKNFQIYMNEARIITHMTKLGFGSLPRILWQKTTNSPNKFMGSGMFPGGAYVTLEHEHILIFRKGNKRIYKGEALLQRRESAYFWEERNIWFSDIWNIKGERQKSVNGENRDRTAAYPLELPLRLINMYSKYGDTVLDPFFGTGTTSIAAMILARNSIGIDIDASFINSFSLRLSNIETLSKKYYTDRINNHKNFVGKREKPLKYVAEKINMPVMTSQEKNIQFYTVTKTSHDDEELFVALHEIFNA